MIKIEMNPNDQKDILELLYYALEQKLAEDTKERWSDKNYWKMRIPQLLEIVGGKDVSPSVVRSTMPNPIKRGKHDLEMDLKMIFGGKK